MHFNCEMKLQVPGIWHVGQVLLKAPWIPRYSLMSMRFNADNPEFFDLKNLHQAGHRSPRLVTSTF